MRSLLEKNPPARFIATTALCLVFLTGCDKPPTGPDDGNNNPVRTDTELRVRTYALAAGESETFPPGFTIVAEEDVSVEGTIYFEPASGSDFRIEAGGDIRVEGTIAPAGYQINGKTADVSCRTIDTLDPMNPGKASSGFFISDGDIILGASAHVVGCDGFTAAIQTLQTASGPVSGYPGGAGGDVVLRAKNGTVRMESGRSFGGPAMLRPGNGGHGGGLILASSFTTSDEILAMVAGDGGASGNVIIEAKALSGIPYASDLGQTGDLIAPASGGIGGDVIWDNRSSTTKYRLQSIVFRGGRGGDGVTNGGDGGGAVYLSGRIIHEDDKKEAPTVLLFAGGGGNVIPTRLPQIVVQGGDGGVAFGIGNKGADGNDVSGDLSEIDGQDGGLLKIELGDGGNVPPGTDAAFPRGGSGATGLAWSNLASRSGMSVKLESGGGGNGYDGCAAEKVGGNAGKTGTVIISGGNGGNVDILNDGGRGGDGARIPSMTHGEVGSPGSGVPPGTGACPVEPEISVAKGGEGNLFGALGTAAGISGGGGCSSDASQCEDREPRLACDRIGAKGYFEYNSFFERTYSDGSSWWRRDKTVAEFTRVREGRVINDRPWDYWDSVHTDSYEVSTGQEYELTSINSFRNMNTYPLCTDAGSLYWQTHFERSWEKDVGLGQFDSFEENWELSGCDRYSLDNPEYIAERWMCCKREDIYVPQLKTKACSAN